jgi:uncharacterized protein YciI
VKPNDAVSLRARGAVVKVSNTGLNMSDAKPNPSAQPTPNERFYVCRLLPPRSNFATDMTPEERQAMEAHAAYWSEHLRRGVAVLYGPVADPKGTWGLGVIRVKDEEQMQELVERDPAILARIGVSYEVLPMPKAVVAP